MSDVQAAALRRDYQLYFWNTPQKLAARYGIALGTVHEYAFNKHKPESKLLRCHRCHTRFERKLGKYGCPNCHGEGLE